MQMVGLDELRNSAGDNDTANSAQKREQYKPEKQAITAAFLL